MARGWVSVSIDRFGLCKPSFLVHVLSHDASDFKHLCAKLGLRVRWSMGKLSLTFPLEDSFSYNAWTWFGLPLVPRHIWQQGIIDGGRGSLHCLEWGVRICGGGGVSRVVHC